jgi:hypothetical protein
VSAAEKLQELLTAGMALIPDLIADSTEEPRAPDLEGYLRATDLAARTQLSVMKLRQAEQEQGASTSGQVSHEEAFAVLLTTSITQRREYAQRLLSSIPAKGMSPLPKKG